MITPAGVGEQIPDDWTFKAGEAVVLGDEHRARGDVYTSEAQPGEVGRIAGVGFTKEAYPEVYKVVWDKGNGSDVDADCLRPLVTNEDVEEVMESIRKAMRP